MGHKTSILLLLILLISFDEDQGSVLFVCCGVYKLVVVNIPLTSDCQPDCVNRRLRHTHREGLGALPDQRSDLDNTRLGLCLYNLYRDSILVPTVATAGYQPQQSVVSITSPDHLLSAFLPC